MFASVCLWKGGVGGLSATGQLKSVHACVFYVSYETGGTGCILYTGIDVDCHKITRCFGPI